MNATVPSIPVWLWLVGFVLANTLINLRGIRMTALFTKVMIVGELIVLAVFLGIGIWALANGRGHGWSLTPLFNSETFTWPIILGAVSVAVLSFLGFDGISMLAEEAKGGATQVGKAIKLALILAGVLFIVQVWVASLLVADPVALLDQGDPSVGVARPLEDAYRIAHADMTRWIGELTGLEQLDAYQLLSQAGTAPTGNVVDPNYTMLAKIAKRWLPGPAAAYAGTHARLRSIAAAG